MDDMDKLLDSALRNYVEQDVPLGMEGRVLRRLSAKKTPRRWWIWALVPAGAVAVVIAVWPEPRPPLPDGRGSARAVVATPPLQPTLSRDREGAVPTRPRQRRVPIVAPPEPPTAQQVALAALVTNYPELALQAMQGPPAELAVEPLKIDPLEITQLGDN